jgi:hypothetical protein
MPLLTTGSLIFDPSDKIEVRTIPCRTRGMQLFEWGWLGTLEDGFKTSVEETEATNGEWAPRFKVDDQLSDRTRVLERRIRKDRTRDRVNETR